MDLYSTSEAGQRRVGRQGYIDMRQKLSWTIKRERVPADVSRDGPAS